MKIKNMISHVFGAKVKKATNSKLEQLPINMKAQDSIVDGINIPEEYLYEKEKNGNNINILDFESYKESTEEGDNWSPAFTKALDFLSQSSRIKKLTIPAQTFTCLDLIHVNAKHNGITIEGEGYGTEIKVMDNAVQDWIFNLRDNTFPLEGITIKNLRLNGNKANLSNTNTTGFGIFAQQGSKISNKNIFIENIWAHDFLTTGINIYSSNIIVTNIFSWNNGFHGLTTANATNITLSNIQCHYNGGYGIDISGGEVILSNFNCTYNVSGGMKTSISIPTVNLQAVNGRLNFNKGVGFQTTQSTGATYFFDNIEANDNGLSGFRLAEGAICTIGKLTSLRNNKNATNNQSASVSFEIPVQVDTLITSENNGYGLSVTSTEEVHIKRIIAKDNNNLGIWLNNAKGANLTIESGTILNNNGAYGILIGNNPNKLTLYNTEFGDTREAKVQTKGIFLGKGSDIKIVACDLTKCTSLPKIFDNGANSIFMRENKGYMTENFGIKSASGNGVAVTFVIPHGLSVTPNFVSITPMTANTSLSIYSLDLNVNNIVITYNAAPPEGTNNLTWAWEVKYKK